MGGAMPGTKDLNAILAYSILLFAVNGDLLGLPLIVLLGWIQVLMGRIRLVLEGNSCGNRRAQQLYKSEVG
eukprot:4621252-Pleurochrysis_carterae.AAC.2